MQVEKELLSISFAVSLYTLIHLYFISFPNLFILQNITLLNIYSCGSFFFVYLRYYYRRIGSATEVFPAGV